MSTETTTALREAGEVSAWSLNPDRTMIAIRETGDSPRTACWTLDPSGQVTAPTPIWDWSAYESVDWNILGWASSTLLTLWRRRADRCELRVVDVTNRDSSPVHYRVIGRPINCRADRSGGFEVFVAVSDGARTLLCLHRPEQDSYLLWKCFGELNGIAAWYADERVLAVNSDSTAETSGVRLFRYDHHGYARIEVTWPPEVRPVNAAGCHSSRIGLTGIDQAGKSVPGFLELSSRTVRWFDAHTGYSAVDLSPSGAHVLAMAWNGEQFTYRVLNIAGRTVGELEPGPGLATDLRFSRDGRHLIGWHQSPTLRPAVVRWRWHDGDTRPVWPPYGRTPVCEADWYLRWTLDAAEQPVPEWVFVPRSGGQRGTVLYLHGGPRGRLNQAYEPVIAALVAAGWNVVGLNYPGSSGYGPEFEALSTGDWGGVDAESIERRLRSLRQRADGRPVCLYGQSYGAYLALLVASNAPGLADGIAVWAPVTDIGRLLDTATGVQRRWLERELGDLRLDARRMWERSPVSRTGELSQLPLLIGHGRQDDRCPVDQSRRLIEQLDGQRQWIEGRVRYQEDPVGSHAPSMWARWTDAVLAHFDRAAVSLSPAGGGIGAAS